MNVPDFLVVGAARAGTTALYYYLNQHPEIFLPKQKEPCFFCFAGKKINYKKGKFAFAVTDPKKYEKLFKTASIGKVKGEISTPYLYLHNETIKNLKLYHSNAREVKIVIILRNPAERAYSQYLWRVRDGREEISFEQALSIEDYRMAQNYSFDYFYLHRGLYYEQVKNYLENFKSVKIILFDDFQNYFGNTMKDLCEFMGVSNFSFTRRSNINSSAIPRFATLGKLMTLESRIKFKILNYLPQEIKLSLKENFNKWNSSSQQPAPIKPETRSFLNEFYKTDIQKLQDLTGIDLNHWLIHE